MSIAVAIGDSRSSFVPQFLLGASQLARLARRLEDDAIDRTESTEHVAFVTGAIMQSCAAMEAEIAEVIAHGPGHHLGSTDHCTELRDFLKPLASSIDREKALDRYQIVLHLLRKAQFARGTEPLQSAELLVQLRNELVHYRSRWRSEMDRKVLFGGLQHLNHRKPPHVPAGSNFFPYRCLSADCAKWSVRTALVLIDEFYKRLEISCPLAPCKSQILAD